MTPTTRARAAFRAHLAWALVRALFLGGCAPPNPAITRSRGVAAATRGDLFVAGNQLEPPYAFEINDDGMLFVNGVRIVPLDPAKLLPQRKATPAIRAIFALEERIERAARKLVNRGQSPAAVRDFLIGELQKSDLVDSAKASGTSDVRVHYKDQRVPQTIFVPDKNTPSRRDRGNDAARRTSMVLRARAIAQALDDGGVVFLGISYDISVPSVHRSVVLAEVESLLHPSASPTVGPVIGALPYDRVGQLDPAVARDLMHPYPLDSLIDHP